MRTQKGILTEETNPFFDADVIVTTAIVGHSIRRLHKNNVNECKYCFEIEFETDENTGKRKLKSLEKTKATWRGMEDAINKISLVLLNSGFCKLGTGVTVGHTPEHDIAKGRIIGGTGDKLPWSLARFSPPMPNPWESNNFVEVKNVIYQGNGAYTGFVFNRAMDLPHSHAMPTVRITIPSNQSYNRWHPDDQSYRCTIKPDMTSLLGPEIGDESEKRVWGMIGSHKTQADLKSQKMRFIQQQEPKASKDIVGYTHGMIRAIYNIEECRITHPGKSYEQYGTPYEIAVGDKTTKLGSCFACAIFMEANGYPASATHLGKCASWCPQYPAKGDESPTARAQRNCNKIWSSYCRDILFWGFNAIALSNRIVDDDDCKESFASLKKLLYSAKDDNSFANLILDAITIHDKDFQRVNRTLKPL